MAGNKNLREANKTKNDEFYTQLEDIEKELRYYKDYFKGKVIFCNCDDPYESNFFKYFAINFNTFGLKKIISTCYAGSPIIAEQLSLFDVKGIVVNKETERNPYKIEITEVTDSNGDGAIDLADVEYLLKNKKNTLTLLKGDGDFRSNECLKLLKESDIVITNPPFSLFREYIAQLMEYNKKFIVIGNLNALSYREIFPLLRDDKMWMGQTYFNGGAAYFIGKKELYDEKKMSNSKNAYIKDGKLYWRVNGVRWFTNLDNTNRHEKIILYKKYTPEEYPKYANFDAINVNKVTEIPKDYYGYMGVPISFMDKYSPDQFKILGLGISNSGIEMGVKPYRPEDKKYRKEVQHKGAVDGDLYMLDANGHPDVPYARIIIKRIDCEENNNGN